jgi:putative ABC transport system substrate-binding protein
VAVGRVAAVAEAAGRLPQQRVLGDPRAAHTAFRQGLAEAGYTDGQNVAIEYRWAEGDNSRLPALVDDLVQRRPTVIAVTGGTATAIAAQAATATIPIVFAIGGDPVKFRLVASLNRPGGNMTGVSFLANSLLAKQVEILHEMVAKDAVIGFLVNPANPNDEADTREVMSAAATLQHRVLIERVLTPTGIEPALASMMQQRIGALLIYPDALFTSQIQQLLALAARHKLPMLYNREFAVAGGLIGYGANRARPIGMPAYTWGGFCGATNLPIYRSCSHPPSN